MASFRFEKKNEYEGKPRGYSDTFYVFGDDGQLRCCCDVFGWCEKAPTRFLKSPDSSEPEFTMKAKRKFMNKIFFLHEGEDGRKFGTLTRKGSGAHWSILDQNDNEVGQFIDPSSIKEVFFRALLDGFPDRYAVVCEKELMARISREKRTSQEEGRGLKKFINKLLTKHDWVLRIEPNAEGIMDERFLIAGTILVLVQDYSTARAK
jgi:hypothetical protein